MAEKQQFFHIVNPAGAIHVVDRDHARWRLGQVGFRLATADEIAAYEGAGGTQHAGELFAPAFSPEPPELPDLPGDEIPDEVEEVGAKVAKEAKKSSGKAAAKAKK